MGDVRKALETLPCPFCGNAKITDWHIRDGRAVGCGMCSAHVVRYQPDALEKAVQRWNTRQALALPDGGGGEADARALAVERLGQIVQQSERCPIPTAAGRTYRSGFDVGYALASKHAADKARAALAALVGG